MPAVSVLTRNHKEKEFEHEHKKGNVWGLLPMGVFIVFYLSVKFKIVFAIFFGDFI